MVENTRIVRHSACIVETKFPSTKVSCSNHLRKEEIEDRCLYVICNKDAFLVLGTAHKLVHSYPDLNQKGVPIFDVGNPTECIQFWVPAWLWHFSFTPKRNLNPPKITPPET
jgi:hypothetical protein